MGEATVFHLAALRLTLLPCAVQPDFVTFMTICGFAAEAKVASAKAENQPEAPNIFRLFPGPPAAETLQAPGLCPLLSSSSHTFRGISPAKQRV